MNSSWHITSRYQIDFLVEELIKNMPPNGWRVEIDTWKDKRTVSQNSLQHAIYNDISKYLIEKGRKDCNPEWVKDMLKNRFLGWEDKEFVDVVTGEKKTRSVLRETSKLDIGESCDYTTQIIEWASSIGLEVKIPANSEYMKWMNEQNK